MSSASVETKRTLREVPSKQEHLYGCICVDCNRRLNPDKPLGLWKGYCGRCMTIRRQQKRDAEMLMTQEQLAKQKADEEKKQEKRSSAIATEKEER